MPICLICGEFHDTPRQTKNCERRFRKRMLSSPTGLEARQLVWKSAYLKRLYRLEILRDEE